MGVARADPVPFSIVVGADSVALVVDGRVGAAVRTWGDSRVAVRPPADLEDLTVAAERARTRARTDRIEPPSTGADAACAWYRRLGDREAGPVRLARQEHPWNRACRAAPTAPRRTPSGS